MNFCPILVNTMIRIFSSRKIVPIFFAIFSNILTRGVNKHRIKVHSRFTVKSIDERRRAQTANFPIMINISYIAIVSQKRERREFEKLLLLTTTVVASFLCNDKEKKNDKSGLY